MTDPRLAEAQEWATKILAETPAEGYGMEYLEGWVEAVAALAHFHDTPTSPSCENCKLVTKFCDAMLGERDG